jgi:hypothetical protein
MLAGSAIECWLSAVTRRASLRGFGSRLRLELRSSRLRTGRLGPQSQNRDDKASGQSPARPKGPVNSSPPDAFARGRSQTAWQPTGGRFETDGSDPERVGALVAATATTVAGIDG